MKNIVINASMLDDKPTGAGVFASNLINYYYRHTLTNGHTTPPRVYTGSDLHLDKRLDIRKLSPLVQASRFRKLAAAYRFLWNQVSYYFIARPYRLSLNPTTHGSLFLNNQVLTILDLLSLRYDRINMPQRFYFKYFLPRLVRKSKRIIAISEATKLDIMHFLGCPGEKIEVIYCGFDKALYHRIPDAAGIIRAKYGLEKFLLGVGPTLPHKNFERLIRAYGKLEPGMRNAYPLVVAGGNANYIRTLKGVAAEAGVDIRFLGYVPQEDLPLLYNTSTALVYPSLFEGFGLPPLEAMACGCPVIVSNTSSLPEVCGEAVRYLDPLDEEDIRAALAEVLGNPGLRRELSDRGLERASLFSWEKAAAQLEALFGRLLGDR